jgi:serine/threonine protein kinase/Tol biopolymer transport system component
MQANFCSADGRGGTRIQKRRKKKNPRKSALIRGKEVLYAPHAEPAIIGHLMAVASGAKLGSYAIESALGAGGMGEVYRARDTRLDRTVAIKVLAAHLASSPELKQRFEREARALSSLNHAHICHLYDIGSQEGTDFLVMEFLEGETLADRLRKGALPLNETYRIGVHVADALQVAHRAGIVHRDLKPGNIMLTKSGAKLMDFGLAKPASLAGMSGSGSAPLLSGAMTMSGASPVTPLTTAGTIIGTIQYMAPEQIAGQDADARSDIFALGAVLYEMATGKRPFEGKSQISVASAILEKDPEPMSVAKPLTPPAFEQLVKNCLAKSPDDRIQTAHDVKLQLQWLSEGGSQTGAPAVASPVPWYRRPWLPWAAAALLLAAWLAALGTSSRHSVPPAVIRATLLPPPGAQFALLNRNGPPSFSPDGTKIAFVASHDGKTSIWVRALEKPDATELPGTEGAFFPFWSPDGRTIGFFANGQMWKMDATGGAPVAIAEAPNGRGASWFGDTILFAPKIGSPIYKVSASGGAPVQTTPNVAGTESTRWPTFLPDGKHFIYLHTPIGSVDERNEVRWGSVDGSKDLPLARGRFYLPGYVSGELLTVRDGTLTAQALDAAAGKLSGEPKIVADHVQVDDLVAGAVFAAHPGVLLFERGLMVAAERMVWADAQGKEVQQVVDAGFLGSSRLSPDGTRVAYPSGNSANDIWISDLRTLARSRVSFGGRARANFGGTFVASPVWSPDSRTLYFSFSESGGPVQIYSRPSDGSRPQQRVLASDKALQVADVTPDSKYLLYEEGTAESAQLKALPLEGKGEPLVVLEHVEGMSGGLAGARNSRVSPNGQWLAYQSNESHQLEVYVTRFPGGGARYQVSLAGGSMAVWARDGKKLYFLDQSMRLMATDVQYGQDAVQIGAPVMLFQTGVRASIAGGGYDVAKDGRFLLVNSASTSPEPLTLVTNWEGK